MSLKITVNNRATPDSANKGLNGAVMIYYKDNQEYENELEIIIESDINTVIKRPIIISPLNTEVVKDLEIEMERISIEDKPGNFRLKYDENNVMLAIGPNIQSDSKGGYSCNQIALTANEPTTFTLNKVFTKSKENRKGSFNISVQVNEEEDETIAIEFQLSKVAGLKQNLLDDIEFKFTKIPTEISIPEIQPGKIYESWSFGEGKVVVNVEESSDVNYSYGKAMKSVLCLTMDNKTDKILVTENNLPAILKIYFITSQDNQHTGNLNTYNKIRDIIFRYVPVEGSANDTQESEWEVQAPKNTNYYFTLTNKATILGNSSYSTIYFLIFNIEANAKDGQTPMYIEWQNMPGYKNGITSIPITKIKQFSRVLKFVTRDSNITSAKYGKTEYYCGENIVVDYDLFGSKEGWNITIDGGRKVDKHITNGTGEYKITAKDIIEWYGGEINQQVKSKTINIEVKAANSSSDKVMLKSALEESIKDNGYESNERILSEKQLRISMHLPEIDITPKKVLGSIELQWNIKRGRYFAIYLRDESDPYSSSVLEKEDWVGNVTSNSGTILLTWPKNKNNVDLLTCRVGYLDIESNFVNNRPKDDSYTILNLTTTIRIKRDGMDLSIINCIS